MAEISKDVEKEMADEQIVTDDLTTDINENELIDDENSAKEDSETSTEESTETDENKLKIEELESKLHEEQNKLLRVLADFENAKRRATLDKEALNKYKAQSLLTGLLPVLDNFERALAVEAKAEEAQSLMTGMGMIYRNLVDSLKSEGLVEIETQDKEFDPNFHQAVMTDNDPEKESGIVLQELQKGYMLKDRVLRPSMVKVNE